METEKVIEGIELVLSAAAALVELETIQEIFDVVYDEGDKTKILPAIMAGRFTADEAEETVTYNFIKPVKQKNDDKESITFHTPTFNDIKYINKGYVFKVDKEGMTIMDMTMLYDTCQRAIIKLSGWPLGLVDRISRKDMRVFLGLMSFLD